MMIIDDRDLELLDGLKCLDNLDKLNHAALIEWEHRRREAERVVQMISLKITNDICRVVGEFIQ